MTSKFYSNGKLLLTGEYLVLDGALSLALPTRYGQSMHIAPIVSHELIWKSMDHQGNIWFEEVFNRDTLLPSREQNEVSSRLGNILKEAKKLNPQFLTGRQGYTIKMQLDFPRDWGLGSSSTLINNIAQWAKVDAHELLWNSFSGSGYDISCAQHNLPILYQLQHKTAHVTEVHFNPPFKEQLFFIYLNKKQNSRDGIAHYKKRDFEAQATHEQISKITQDIVSCTKIELFEELITTHETVLSQVLGLSTIKQNTFKDYPRALKSLGAWGGDFILAIGNRKEMDYFSNKGFHTIIPYEQMVL